MPTVLTIQPTTATQKDTYVYQAAPTSNYSTNDPLPIGHTGTTNGIYRAFIEIPTTDIPTGCGVSSGVLWLHCSTAPSTVAHVFNAQRVTESWSATAVTYNAQPAVSTVISAVSTVSTFGVKYQWPITTLVQDWANGTYSNYGVRIAADVESSGTANAKSFNSGDNASTSYRPQLILRYTNAPSVTAVSPTGSVSAPTTFTDSVQVTLSAVYTQSTDTADMAHRRDYIYDMAGNLMFDSSKAASTAVSGSTVSTSIPLGYLKYGRKYKWVCRLYDSYGGYAESTAYFICKLTATPAATDLAGGEHLYAITTSGRVVALESGTVNIDSTAAWSWDYSMPVKVKDVADWTDLHKTLEYVRVAYEMDTSASLSVSYSTRLVDLGDTADYRSVESLTGGSGIQVKKVHIGSAGADERTAHFHRIKLSGEGPCKVYSVVPVYRETVRNT